MVRRVIGAGRSLLVLVAAIVAGGCGPGFYHAVTPSGGPCPDMPLIPFGQALDQPYGRIKAVASDVSASNNSERMETLRKRACAVGADAVIEITTDEVRLPTRNVLRIDGMAVRYKPVKR